MKTLKKISTLSSLLLTMCILFASNIALAQDAKVIEMKGTNQLRFSVEKIEATPGQQITVELTNDTKMPAAAMSHNFVLLKHSADASAVAQASAKYANNKYIAPDMKDQIIAYTDMAGGGETVKVTFKAPTKPGNYTYICTFPGHFLGGMTGTLTVK